MKMSQTRAGLILVILGLAALSAMGASKLPAELSPATPLAGESDREFETIRTKLTPVVESTLQKHCGENCPSYKIELRMKKDRPQNTDDLGFEAVDVKPEAKSVGVTVLIQDKVPKDQRQSLSEILSYRVSNQTELPVHVALKALKAPAPAEAGAGPSAPPRTWLEVHGRALIWPACALALAMMALAGMLVYWRNRRAESHEAFLRSQPKNAAGRPVLPEVSPEEIALRDLLKTRAHDLAWLVEEKAAISDGAALRRLLAVFPADTLTSTIALSPDTLATIAARTDAKGEIGGAPESPQETLPWLTSELDRAHWHRQNEEHHPLAGLQRYSDARLLELFRGLESGPARAAFFGALPQDRWPYLLGHMSSEARVQVGTDLHSFQNAGTAERLGAESLVRSAMGRMQTGAANLTPEGTVEDFTLYLSDQEGRTLWQRLAVAKNPSRSIESLLGEMSPEALLEVCLGMELGSLKILLARLSESARGRILSVLPKNLRERLTLGGLVPKSEGDSDPDYIRARAQFLGTYRQVSGDRSRI